MQQSKEDRKRRLVLREGLKSMLSYVYWLGDISNKDEKGRAQIEGVVRNIDFIKNNIDIDDETVLIIHSCYDVIKKRMCDDSKSEDILINLSERYSSSREIMDLIRDGSRIFEVLCEFHVATKGRYCYKFWPELIKNGYSLYGMSGYNIGVSVMSQLESVWAATNFEEYSIVRLSDIKSKDYIKRSIAYGATIMSGNADSKISRVIRSDGSCFTSSYCFGKLISSKHLYSYEDWTSMILKFSDTRYYDVGRQIAMSVPKDLLMYFVGNPNIPSDILKRRFEEEE